MIFKNQKSKKRKIHRLHKDHLQNLTVNILLHSETLSAYPLSLETKQDIHFTSLTQHSARSSSQCDKARQGNKKHIQWKEIKQSLIVDDIIVYVQIPRESTKKFLELISNFSKVTGYKMNMQNQPYLYTH